MTYFGDPALAKSLFNSLLGKNGYVQCWDENGNFLVPDGFKHLGTGCYRTALLHVDSGLVYKVGNYSANVHEAHMSRKLISKSQRNLPFVVKVPRTRTYRMPNTTNNRGYVMPNCVTVQEYAEGAEYTECDASDDWMDDVPACSCGFDTCNAEALRIIGRWSTLSDIHSGNVLRDARERFWLIDMGC